MAASEDKLNVLATITVAGSHTFCFTIIFVKNCGMHWQLLSACWSSGMILAYRARGNEFDSRESPWFEDFVKGTFLD